MPDAYATANATYPLLAGSTSGIPYDWVTVDVVAQGVGVGCQHRLRLRIIGRRCPVRAVDGALRQVPRRSGNNRAPVKRWSKAKQDYFATQGVYGSYDEKSLQQVVFYGIPMFRLSSVEAGPASPSLTAAAAAAPASSNGLTPQAGSGGLPASAPIADTAFNVTPRISRRKYRVHRRRRDARAQRLPDPTEDEHRMSPQPWRGTPREAPRSKRCKPAWCPGLCHRWPGRRQTVAAVSVLCSQRRSSSQPPSRQSAARRSNQRLVVFPGQFSDLDPTPGAERRYPAA